MPRTLAPIPVGTAIVNAGGAITDFFRLRWEELRASFAQVITAAQISLRNQNAAIVTTLLYTPLTGGQYRISWYLRKTIADGAASSAQLTFGWTDNATPVTEAQTALVLDTTSAQQSGSKVLYADQNSPMTYAVAYSSTSPNAMHYLLEMSVEQLA